MPHPGLKVATNSKFDGTFSGDKADYLKQITHCSHDY